MKTKTKIGHKIALVTTLFLTACTQDQGLSQLQTHKQKLETNSMVSPSILSVKYYYTRISQIKEYKLKVEELSDGTFDVYVSTQAANHPVRAYFSSNYVTRGHNEFIITLPEGTYTYLKVDKNGVELIDNSAPIGGSTSKYTCPCCSGNGNCTLEGDIDPETGKFTVDCGENSCVQPEDGTVTCELKSSKGITGGGILFETGVENIRIHYN